MVASSLAGDGMMGDAVGGGLVSNSGLSTTAPASGPVVLASATVSFRIRGEASTAVTPAGDGIGATSTGEGLGAAAVSLPAAAASGAGRFAALAVAGLLLLPSPCVASAAGLGELEVRFCWDARPRSSPALAESASPAPRTALVRHK